MDWLIQAYNDDSPWMYGILVGQVMMVSIIVERAFILFVAMEAQGQALGKGVEKLLAEGDLDRAQKLVRLSLLPQARLMKVGLAAFDGNPAQVKEKVENALPGEIRRFSKRIAGLVLLAVGVFAVGVVGTAQSGSLNAPIGSGPLPFGLPLHFAPLLDGTLTAAIAMFFAVIFGLRTWTAAGRLREIPAQMSRLAYRWKDRS